MYTKDEILSAIDWGVQYALNVRGLENVFVEVQHAEPNVIRVVYVQRCDGYGDLKNTETVNDHGSTRSD